MIIPISDNWRLETDPLNFILQQRHTAKTGTVTWPAVSYHGDLHAALASYADRQIKGLERLSQLSKAVSRIKAEIAKIPNCKPKEVA